MSSNSLLWIGNLDQNAASLMEILQTELDQINTINIADQEEAVLLLTKERGKFLVVIIDLDSPAMDFSTLATRIKHINPIIEVILYGSTGRLWKHLNLPRYNRPIIVDRACGADVLISSIAKLFEMIETKQDFDRLSRGLGDNLGISRTSTEIVLSLLAKQNRLGMISMRRDGFFTSYNSEAERLTGYSFEELAHIHVWAEAILTDNESVRTLLDSISLFWVKKIGRENMRLKIRKKDGRLTVMSVTTIVLLDNAGQARQIVALFYDPLETGITREYELLLNSNECAIYSYLPDRGFTRISSAALNLINRAFSLNLSWQDIIDRRITEIGIPEDLANTWEKGLLSVLDEDQQNQLMPLGLPGKHILEHKYIAKIQSGSAEKYSILAIVAPREDLLCDSFQHKSIDELAWQTLRTIPNPFLIFKAKRNETDYIEDFTSVAINPAGTHFLGLEQSQEELTIFQIFKDPAAVETIFYYAKETTETGSNNSFELPIIVDINKPKVLANFWLGKVADGVAIIFRDVTALRQEENQLKQYRHIFSHMQEAIIVTDLDGNIIDWNPASETMFGYTKERILGQHTNILTENPDGAPLKQNYKTILKDGDVWTGEYEFVRENGSKGIASTVFALLRNDQGEAYGTVGLCHDLTERKRLEERLMVKSQELQEKNLALNTLLRHAEAERLRACEQVIGELTRKVNEKIFRILELKTKPYAIETQAKLLLEELGVATEVKEFKRSDPVLKLTDKELEVAQLIRLGKTTEEIAFILEKSPDTVRLQRISIRKKLGLGNKERNLASYLKKLDLS